MNDPLYALEPVYEILIERTEDVDFVNSVIHHPEIENLASDEGPRFQAVRHPYIYYLVPRIEKPLGVMMFLPVNSITWNPHIALFQEFRGKGLGTGAIREAIRWMFRNTPCRKLIAFPPQFNLGMYNVFTKVGFKREGFSPKSVMKDGHIYGRYILGLEK